MRSLICILTVGLFGFCLSLPQQKGTCAFGQEYNDGCNHCVCHGASGSTCTRLPGCKSGSGSKSVGSTRDYNSQYNRGHCSLGSEFMKDCNICTCQGDLGYICTSKECESSAIPESPSIPTKGTTDIRGKCVLGHKFFSGCDLCTCYGEHFGYRCSRMDNCREQYYVSTTPSTTSRPSYYEKNLDKDKCSHGASYYDGYYYCTCRKDNLGYVCKSTLS